ncbi:MAG: hypothetical protein OES84_04005 [Kiritimatiellaceae bacterium]|nr:hypothetical protein [Kiritimatiellaceae bacterium]
MKLNNLFGVLSALLLVINQVGASGMITALRKNNVNMDLTINTTAAERYIVQCTTNLIDTSWSDIKEFQANDDVTIESVSSTAASCYFRVVKSDDQSVAENPDTPPSPPPPPPPPPAMPNE